MQYAYVCIFKCRDVNGLIDEFRLRTIADILLSIDNQIIYIMYMND